MWTLEKPCTSLIFPLQVGLSVKNITEVLITSEYQTKHLSTKKEAQFPTPL
jgi:hypothetical protein